MNKLLVIFGATKFIVFLFRTTAAALLIFALWCLFWLWYDYMEIRLRTKIEAQVETIKLYKEANKDCLEQQVKLIDLNADHINMRRTFPGKCLIWQRPDILGTKGE